MDCLYSVWLIFILMINLHAIYKKKLFRYKNQISEGWDFLDREEVLLDLRWAFSAVFPDWSRLAKLRLGIIILISPFNIDSHFNFHRSFFSIVICKCNPKCFWRPREDIGTSCNWNERRFNEDPTCYCTGYAFSLNYMIISSCILRVFYNLYSFFNHILKECTLFFGLGHGCVVKIAFIE